jgi:hypothetical protein
VLRKVFDRGRGEKFPLEEEAAELGEEDSDPTLIS